MANRKRCVRVGCENKQQYSKHGVCSWHYKELMGIYPQRPQRHNPNNKPAANKTEWEWIKDYLKL
jgi:hypothetical protein